MVFVYIALGQYSLFFLCFLFFIFYFILFLFCFPLSFFNYMRHVPDRCRHLAVSQRVHARYQTSSGCRRFHCTEYCKKRCTRMFCDWTVSQGFALQSPLGCTLPIADLRSTISFGCLLSRIPKWWRVVHLFDHVHFLVAATRTAYEA